MKYFQILKKRDYSLELKKIIKDNPKGLFFSVFRQNHNKIIYGKTYLDSIDIMYSTYHLCYGNDMNNILYMTTSDLPYRYQKYIHEENICNFSGLEENLQKKIINNIELIDKFEDMNTFDKLNKIIRNKLPKFILFEDKDYHKTLNKIYLKQHLEKTLSREKPIKEKVSKI